MSLGVRMEEMIFNLADSHLFFNDLEVKYKSLHSHRSKLSHQGHFHSLSVERHIYIYLNILVNIYSCVV